jgi:uncharacterized repeat protein (TIGR01451 family)
MKQNARQFPLTGVSRKKQFPISGFLLLTMLVVGNLPVVQANNSDSYGYTYLDSNTPGGPTYDWIEISSTGTQVLQPGAWLPWVDNVDLGFSFHFYGTERSQLSIGNNGLLSFEAGTRQSMNGPITQTPGIHDFIAPYYCGNFFNTNQLPFPIPVPFPIFPTNQVFFIGEGIGPVYCQTLGTAPNRIFVVEWQYLTPDPSYLGITFEAILYEGSNNILFQYKDVAIGLSWLDNGASATVGIEDSFGNMGLEYSFMQPVITPGLAILYSHPTVVSEANMYVSISAPAGMDYGQTMTYTLSYGNLGGTAASDTVLNTTLSPGIEFVSASDGGTYNAGNVTWNLGSVAAYPNGLGTRTVTVAIPSVTTVGTVIESSAAISTSTFETRYDDNAATVQTVVTGLNLPPNVGLEGATANPEGKPQVRFTTPLTYTYYDSAATSVDITIHLDDGGPDITGTMTGPAPTWTYTVTFYPRYGDATVIYTVHYSTGGSQVGFSFNIYVDPAGYIYNVVTLERISDASVWLQRPNGRGGWANVSAGESPAVMQPDVNPLTTGANGQYQWDTLPGTYRVHVEASGYYPADSIVVTVPPPVTDLHVGLTPLPVINSPPAVGVIAAPNSPVQIDTVVSVSANFVDPDIRDTHTAVWNWGDGSASKGTVTEANGLGSVTGTHAYASGGVYTTTLTVSDNYTDASSTVMINVLFDTSGPMISIAATPSVLWPANGKMVEVAVSGQITDAVSGLDLSGASFSVTDDYGEIQPQGKLTVGASGTYSFALQLKAQRNGNDKDGRHYTIRVRASDRAGNPGSVTTVVTAPHDHR